MTNKNIIKMLKENPKKTLYTSFGKNVRKYGFNIYQLDENDKLIIENENDPYAYEPSSLIGEALSIAYQHGCAVEELI